MGIKFKGKTSTGAPILGNIAERELHINLADEDLYTSSDGNDVILLTDTPHGYFDETNKVSFIPDMRDTDFFDITVMQNSTIDTPVNFKEGDIGTIQVRQNDVGGHTIGFSDNYIFEVDDPKILTGQYAMMVFDYAVTGGKVYMEYVASYDTIIMTP